MVAKSVTCCSLLSKYCQRHTRVLLKHVYLNDCQLKTAARGYGSYNISPVEFNDYEYHRKWMESQSTEKRPKYFNFASNVIDHWASLEGVRFTCNSRKLWCLISVMAHYWGWGVLDFTTHNTKEQRGNKTERQYTICTVRQSDDERK